MFVRKLALFLICLFISAVGSVSAQSDARISDQEGKKAQAPAAGSTGAQSDARIRTALHSIDQVEGDLKWLVELSPTPDLRKQWKPLKEDILDAMTQGIDLTKPIAVDVVFRKDELTYEYRIPILSLDGKDGFLNGLDGIGFKVKTVTKGSYYEFAEKNQKPFYLRYDGKYAWISKTAIPATLPNAVEALNPLLALNKDVVSSLKNDAEGIATRRANYKELRKQFEAAIKIRRNEDPNAFELRKLVAIQQYNDGERFIVEPEELLISWITSSTSPKPFARGELSLTALPGTDLLKSIQEIAVKPSYFANVKLHPNPLASGKLNFALDSVRIAHLKEFYKAVRPVVEAEIAKLPNTTDAQKKATKQATNKFLDLLDTGTSLKVVDAFMDGFTLEQDATVKPTKNVMICGIRAVNGKLVDEILKLLPQVEAGWQVKSEPTEHGGVSIYEVTVPKPRLAAFQKLFPSESILFVGTSKDAVWGAAGVDAVKHLNEAIDQTALPAPDKADPVFASYQFRLEQLVNLIELAQTAAPAANAPKTKEQKQQEKDLEKYRKLAQDTMVGCNSLMHGEVRRTDDKIEGFLELSDCVLKFIGAMIADGVKVLQ